MFELSGKTALITGATGGLGSAIARTLHAQGAKLAISGTRAAVLESLASELGGDVHCLPCDLSKPDEVEALVPAAEAALGSLDILVNNAGVTRDRLVMRMKDEDWQAVLDINLTAGFRLSRAALKGMMRRRNGRIVMITSTVGTTGNAGQANYAASKAATTAMTKSLASEIASRGITVNCVAPGFTVSPMTDSMSDAQKERVLSSIPMGRFGFAPEVAASVAFLVSDEASYVTGQTLHVNGGIAMI